MVSKNNKPNQTDKKDQTDKPQKKRVRWGRIIGTTILSMTLLGCVSVGILLFITAGNLPEFDPVQLGGNNSTLVYDNQQQLISRLHSGENRTEIDYDKIPPDLVNAFVAMEDQNFYKHHGVDIKGIIRAIVNNITKGDLTDQGASTITQQLARNAFLEFDKVWDRKIKELLLAFKIESTYSKEEIMTMYINKIYYGSNRGNRAYGVEAAANNFFGKNAIELSLSECAMLAGVAQLPSHYDMNLRFDECRNRQRLVLNNMVECGFITEEEADFAWNDDIPVVIESSNIDGVNMAYGYYIDAVIDEALRILASTPGYETGTETALYSHGFKIYTNMDATLQSFAENYFTNEANFPNQSVDENIIQSAFTVIDHSDGAVKALLGGRKYEFRRGFNRATTAYRMPGSTIKPLTVYSPALEMGHMPFQAFDDSPLHYVINGTSWRPTNYDHSYRGIISMRTGVQYSINTYAVQMLDTIGVQSAFDMGKALGLTLVGEGPANDLALSPLSLGSLTIGTNTMEMANAYAAIANNGIYNDPYLIQKITDRNGQIIYEHTAQPERVMSQETAWLMTSMLQTVTAAGTGVSAKVPGVPTAGKTGTSEEYRDSWFCGFTPRYSVAVWMGYDMDHTMNRVFGGGYPAQMFKALLTKAHETVTPGEFTMPSTITSVRICIKSGMRPSDICPAEHIVQEYTASTHALPGICDVHQIVTICPESNLLAGRYCPGPINVARVKTRPESVDRSRIPTATCDIHDPFSSPDMLDELSPDEEEASSNAAGGDHDERPNNGRPNNHSSSPPPDIGIPVLD